MKFLIKSIMAFVLLLALALPARAQVTPLTTGQFTTTNVLAGLSDNVTFIVATNSVRIDKGSGIGLIASVTPAAVTNVATLRFQVSHDGVVWQHATPHVLALNLTSVGTNYIFGTNLSPAQVENWQYIRLYSIVTANTNALTNAVYWSRRN